MMLKQPFNQLHLTHYEYHWFWGLLFHEEKHSPNLAERTESWQTNVEKVRAVQEKQKKIDHYFLLFKWIYWLFNINNYAADFYQLAAFVVCSEAAKDDKIMKSVSDVVSSPFRAINRGLHAVWDKIIAAIPQSKSTNSGPKVSVPGMAGVESDDCEFEICERMQDHLKALGLSVSNQTKLLWRDIKKAYRDKALVAHPDKGGSNQAFLDIKSAFDALHQLVFDATSSNEEDPIAAAYYARVAKLFADIVELDAGMDRVRVGQEEVRAGQEEVRAGQAEVRAGQAEVRAGQAEVRAGQEEIARRQAANAEVLNAIAQGMEQNQRELDKIAASQERTRLRQDEADRLLAEVKVMYQELEPDARARLAAAMEQYQVPLAEPPQGPSRSGPFFTDSPSQGGAGQADLLKENTLH
jgi:hypothetical protein